MAHCGFKIDIYDEKSGKYVPYICPEPKENNFAGLCVFHDENYLKDLKLAKEAKEQNLRNKLTEKLAKSEPLICIGYYLPDLSFEELHLDKSVNFAGTEFMGMTNFSKTQFKEADFSRARFAKEANFSDAQFTGEANFPDAEFNREAYFTEAQFIERANFSDAKFIGEANFSDAKFIGEANFTRARFADTTYFPDAEFNREAYFTEARFADTTYFPDAEFNREAYFTGAQFTKQASFYGAQFAGLVVFTEAQFTEKANFSLTYFKEAVFIQTKFKESFFRKTQFADKADFSEIQSTIERTLPHLDFHNVQFDIPEHITFLKDNLSEVSFVNTDITRVRFGEDVVWGDRFKIREERKIENQLKTKNIATDIQLGDVLAVYRNLRENYEFRMRYDEAGQFFIREMEMKRRYQTLDSRSKKNIFRLKWWIKEISLSEEKDNVGLGQNDWASRNISLTGLYYHLSRYGQSFSRPALFGVGIVALSTLLWLTQLNPTGDFSYRDMTIPQILTINKTSGQTNLEIAFVRSLTNFLPSLSFGTDTIGLLDIAFKIVGGAVTFGLIIIALRRKFERKFRH